MRTAKAALILIISFISVSCLFLYAWLTSSLPKMDGNIALEGIQNTITVARDKHGIPHITASSDDDLAFALGYVHAQDRLWQMTVNRRIGRGELAEIIGEPGLNFDRYFRTLGFTHKAMSAYEALGDTTKSALAAYAYGVNTYVKHHKGALPPEFLLTQSEPSLWSPIDTLVWMKMMALDLSGNMRHEIARARLLTKITPAQLSAIYPTYEGDVEPPLPQLDHLFKNLPLDKTALVVGNEPPEGYGSNNWVVSGVNTKTGLPLLANDPHLGLTTPSIWYLARLHNSTTGHNLVGVSFPGAPSIILGHNGKIAWSFTNTYPDTQDLFIEKLIGDDSYLTPTGPANFITREEVIKVKGDNDITLTVRETRHGPVISDILNDTGDFTPDGYVLALQWTALMEEDHGVTALMKLGKAQNFEEFQEAGKGYTGPEQNMIYADTDGNIGYYAPALVPIRHPENQILGRLPSPGWDGRYDWQGFVPYDELPTRYNPNGGVIATANEKIVPDDYPHFITRDWSLPYRGNRIRHVLAQTREHDTDSFAALHGDIISDMARDILPSLIAVLQDDSAVKRLLQNWDGTMDKDRPEPLIFQTWLHAYQKLIMSDELGDLYTDFTRTRPQLIKSSLYWSLTADKRPANNAYYSLPLIDETVALDWCDDTRTSDRQETCARYANRAMTSVVEELSALYGSNSALWKWGTEHIAHQKHRPFSEVPQLRDFFELSAPVSGGRYTVNVTGVSRGEAGSRHQSTHGPSYRGIFDLNDLEKSRFVQPTGQSGNVLSDHYDDMFGLWQNVQFFEIPTSTVIPHQAEGIITLHPKD